jgi:hypothetical protein
MAAPFPGQRQRDDDACLPVQGKPSHAMHEQVSPRGLTYTPDIPPNVRCIF